MRTVMRQGAKTVQASRPGALRPHGLGAGACHGQKACPERSSGGGANWAGHRRGIGLLRLENLRRRTCGEDVQALATSLEKAMPLRVPVFIGDTRRLNLQVHWGLAYIPLTNTRETGVTKMN